MAREIVTRPDDWEKKTQGLTDDVGREIDSREAGGAPQKEDRVKLRRLADVGDEMAFFSLGPAYVLPRVPVDILADFATTTGARFSVWTRRFDFRLFNGIGDWDYILQGLPTPVFNEFRRFMDTQSAKSDNEYWKFRCQSVLVADPFAIETKTLQPMEPSARIAVFVPTGSRRHFVIPGAVKEYPIPLYSRSPLPEVQREARGVLGRELSPQEYEQFFREGKRPFG